MAGSRLLSSEKNAQFSSCKRLGWLIRSGSFRTYAYEKPVHKLTLEHMAIQYGLSYHMNLSWANHKSEWPQYLIMGHWHSRPISFQKWRVPNS